MAEQGNPVMDIGWFALIGPPRLCAENVSALAGAVEAILEEEEARAALAKVGLNPWRKNSQELSQLMNEESRRWDKLIRERNITE